MWKLTFAQLRHHPGRYISTLIAIAIGTMFLAGSLLVDSSAKATLQQALGEEYSGADLIVYGTNGDIEVQEALAELGKDTLNEVEGVHEALPLTSYGRGLVRTRTGMSAVQGTTFNDNADYVSIHQVPQDPTLISRQFHDTSQVPGPTGEVAIPQTLAERNDLHIGDTVTIDYFLEDVAPVTAKISGVLKDPETPTAAFSAPTIWASPDVTQQVARQTAEPLHSPDHAAAEKVLVRLDEDANQMTVKDLLSQALVADQRITAKDFEVGTPEEIAVLEFEAMSDVDVFTSVMVAFSAIAIFVTVLVINNTFSVLVAQRSRQYALQRVLGATRGQVLGTVLGESLMVGAVGSIAGIALATLAVWGMVAVSKDLVGYNISTFALSPHLWIVVLVGMIVTLIAAILPAITATRVSPLAAMRPQAIDGDTASQNGKRRISLAQRLRVIAGAALFILGTGVMIWASFARSLLIAVPAGMVSAVGLLMMAVVLVPGAVYAVGGLARATAGVPGRMAQLNAVRNPHRTAATGAALLVGTVLVAMMLTGGRTAQNVANDSLELYHPADIYATTVEASSLNALEDKAQQVMDSPDGGVASVQTLPHAGQFQEPMSGGAIYAIDREELAESHLSDNGEKALAKSNTVVVSQSWAFDNLEDPKAQDLTVEVTGTDGETHTLDLVVAKTSHFVPLVSAETAEALGGVEVSAGHPGVLWVQLDNSALTTEGIKEITDHVTSVTTPSGQVDAPIGEKYAFNQIIEMMLMIVVALLGISVLIALVGVANTLSLSAMERTRENSLMRALGLTRNGLRGMLALEAVLIAGVSALLGCIFGVLYGWAGAQAVFGHALVVTFDGLLLMPNVPWWELGVVVLIAILAGLVASILPGRRAANLPPVKGLASE